MANVVDGRCSYVTVIYIARTIARSIIYIAAHSSKIAFAIRPIYICITDAVVVVTAIDAIIV